MIARDFGGGGSEDWRGQGRGGDGGGGDGGGGDGGGGDKGVRDGAVSPPWPGTASGAVRASDLPGDPHCAAGSAPDSGMGAPKERWIEVEGRSAREREDTGAGCVRGGRAGSRSGAVRRSGSPPCVVSTRGPLRVRVGHIRPDPSQLIGRSPGKWMRRRKQQCCWRKKRRQRCQELDRCGTTSPCWRSGRRGAHHHIAFAKLGTGRKPLRCGSAWQSGGLSVGRRWRGRRHWVRRRPQRGRRSW